MTTRTEQLYEEDFYVWTQRQAAALRRLADTRPNVGLDFPHLIEEVEDLGTGQRDAVRSHMRRIIEHCLKLEFCSAVDPRGGWYASIIDARTEIDDKLSPSLSRDLDEQLPRLWNQARSKADNGLRRFGEPDAADLLPAIAPMPATICSPTAGIRPIAAGCPTIGRQRPRPVPSTARSFSEG